VASHKASNIAAQKLGYIFQHLLFGPIPPSDCEEFSYDLVVEAEFDDLCGVADDHGVRWDISPHDSMRANDRAITDLDPSHQRSMAADPDIVSHNDVASTDGEVGYPRRVIPSLESREGIHTDPIRAVISTKEDLYIVGDRSVLSTYEPIALSPVTEGWSSIGMISNYRRTTLNQGA
jgi:hypothetical protein